MGKHNGKSRRTGIKVGAALVSRSKQGSKGGSGEGKYKHTTDTNQGQSILERSDLDELMAMADLAERDFAAERGHAIVISSGAVDAKDLEKSLEERLAAEARLASQLKIPRRPAWTSATTPEQLDAQERSSFLEWRRGLANVEEEERLVLTPFERNLEVWRQLWRVVERSHIVCQVVDSRDPLLYWSEDLRDYCHEICPTKASYMILNKSDLLPIHVRQQWADYFDSKGVEYIFFSAFAAAERQKREKQEEALMGAGAAGEGAVALSRAAHREEVEERVRVVDENELLQWMEERAEAAVGSSQGAVELTGRYMVGLVGYPNVGKSSTINALFGAKKAAVGPTPGKTKHFQTLNVSASVCLCDCPGLVFPRFAAGKAEMVAAGVIPIDRLTDMRAPCDVVTARCGRWQLESVYGIRLPVPQPHEAASTVPTAEQALRALGLARGWALACGLPDEVRAGRLLLKDYTTGKLLHCTLPPGSSPSSWTPQGPSLSTANGAAAGSTAGGLSGQRIDGSEPSTGTEADSQDEQQVRSAPAATSGQPAAPQVRQPALSYDEADLELLQSLDMGSTQKKVRADHKFHKKIARSKGDRGLAKDGGGYDGAAMSTGKKGGLVRVAGY